MIFWVTVVVERTVIDNDCQTIKVICVPSVDGVLTWLVSYKLAMQMVVCQLSRNTIAYEDWVMRFDPSFVLLIKVVIVIQYFGLSSQSIAVSFA